MKVPIAQIRIMRDKRITAVLIELKPLTILSINFFIFIFVTYIIIQARSNQAISKKCFEILRGYDILSVTPYNAIRWNYQGGYQSVDFFTYTYIEYNGNLR